MTNAITSAAGTTSTTRRTRRVSSQALAIALLVILNGMIVGGAYWWRTHAIVIPETPLAHGAVVPDAIMQTLRGQLGDRWDYVALLFSEPTAEKLRYVNVLGARYGNGRVKLAYVSDDAHLDRARRVAGKSLPVIPDTSLAIHTALHVPTTHEHGGLIVLARTGHIEFWRLPQPGADDLRQLVEKFAGVPIDYEVKATGLLSRFAPGRPLPALTLIGVDGQPRGALADMRKSTLVVFAGGCKSCELSRRVWQLQTIRKLTLADTDRRFLIVTPGGDPAWNEPLDAFQRQAGVPAAEIVLTQGDVERDPYWTRYGQREEAPIVVQIGEHGEVVTIETLEDATSA